MELFTFQCGFPNPVYLTFFLKYCDIATKKIRKKAGSKRQKPFAA